MRAFPQPLLSGVLLVSWLGLQGSVAPGTLLLAVTFAIVLPLLLGRIVPSVLRPQRPLVVLKLFATVLWDILVANIDVARRILGPEAAIHPAFFRYPLQLRDPLAIAILSSVVTLTPGTVIVDTSDDGRELVVHALHIDDTAALIAHIRERYEAPLQEIFPCS